jgi:hypothetical protein
MQQATKKDRGIVRSVRLPSAQAETLSAVCATAKKSHNWALNQAVLLLLRLTPDQISRL